MIDRSSRGSSATRALRALCLLSLVATVAACASKGEKTVRPDNPFRPDSPVGPASSTPKSESELKLEALAAYKQANAAMVSSDNETALKRYSQLISRYPFTEFSTQAELEKIFVQYRSFQPDEALLAADRFLREHPRHAHADYVQYLKGLINSSRAQSISDFLPLDSSKKDVTSERRAYDDFAVLLQRYPNSAYAGDARKRMIYLRNRVASHELSVVRYYVKRQAWVAVAKRAENLIAEFPGAPATADALLLLKLSYDKLGLKTQSADADLLIASNAAAFAAASAPDPVPGPRTDITKTAATAAAAVEAAPAAATAAPAAAPAAADKPKGFFGKLGGMLDGLNKTYTLDGKDAPVAKAGESATIASPSSTGSASLVTGPATSEPTVINIAPIGGSSETKSAETVKQPEAAAAAPAEKKEKAGFFDFLNKTYTIGTPKKAADAAAKDAPDAKGDAAASESTGTIKLDYEAPDGTTRPASISSDTPDAKPAKP